MFTIYVSIDHFYCVFIQIEDHFSGFSWNFPKEKCRSFIGKVAIHLNQTSNGFKLDFFHAQVENVNKWIIWITGFISNDDWTCRRVIIMQLHTLNSLIQWFRYIISLRCLLRSCENSVMDLWKGNKNRNKSNTHTLVEMCTRCIRYT